MLLSSRNIIRGVGWTTILYFIAVGFRFVSSVILSRLLAPNIMGMMVIINTIRLGVELFSDIGIGQNIVQNKNGGRPTFYNTAWIIQIARGFFLSSILFLFARTFSEYYQVDDHMIQAASLSLALAGFMSTSIYLMQRHLKIVQLSVFELSQEVMASTIGIIAAIINPSIWSLIIAGVISTAIRVILTHFLPGAGQMLIFSKKHAGEIFSFGKWIFLSSLLMFMSSNFDRLFLGQVAPLAMLGVYGISRAIADLPSVLVNRLSHSLVFPVIASARTVPRAEVRARLSRLRLKLLAAAAIALAAGISVADLVVHVIYDDRYLDAGWMLIVLLSGVWLSILASLNEYSLLGLGRPVYGVIGNTLKLGALIYVLPHAFAQYGMFGAVVGIAMADLPRLCILLFGQFRERFSFIRQDIATTIQLALFIVIFSAVRYYFGFGTLLDTLPIR
ncbi:O-antigen/teichoic acid export membrane protein [Bosea sp. 124]|nr:O-antigen/teichoic acid export membrane protein [Bosea sp. 124]